MRAREWVLAIFASLALAGCGNETSDRSEVEITASETEEALSHGYALLYEAANNQRNADLLNLIKEPGERMEPT